MSNTKTKTSEGGEEVEEELELSQQTLHDVEMTEAEENSLLFPETTGTNSVEAQNQDDTGSTSGNKAQIDEGRPERRRFTGASQRRIRKLIRDGMTPDEARDMEAERYDLWKAEQEKQKADLNKPADSKKRPRSDGSTPEKPGKKSANSGTNESSSTTTNQVLNPNQAGTSQSTILNSEKPGTISYRDVAAHCKVAIMHAHHPCETLREEEIKKIKRAIADELDKVEADGPVLQFVANARRDGWLSVTCNNKETKDWMIKIGSTMQPWKDAQLKVADTNEMPKLHTCVAHISPEETMPKERFASRVAKQNPGLNTSSWRILRVDKEKNGGQTFAFAVDDASLAYLQKNNCRLFLTLSKIQIRIKGQSTHDTPGNGVNAGQSGKDRAGPAESSHQSRSTNLNKKDDSRRHDQRKREGSHHRKEHRHHRNRDDRERRDSNHRFKNGPNVDSRRESRRKSPANKRGPSRDSERDRESNSHSERRSNGRDERDRRSKPERKSTKNAPQRSKSQEKNSPHGSSKNNL